MGHRSVDGAPPVPRFLRHDLSRHTSARAGSGWRCARWRAGPGRSSMRSSMAGTNPPADSATRLSGSSASRRAGARADDCLLAAAHRTPPWATMLALADRWGLADVLEFVRSPRDGRMKSAHYAAGCIAPVVPGTKRDAGGGPSCRLRRLFLPANRLNSTCLRWPAVGFRVFSCWRCGRASSAHPDWRHALLCAGSRPRLDGPVAQRAVGRGPTALNMMSIVIPCHRGDCPRTARSPAMAAGVWRQTAPARPRKVCARRRPDEIFSCAAGGVCFLLPLSVFRPWWWNW